MLKEKITLSDRKWSLESCWIQEMKGNHNLCGQWPHPQQVKKEFTLSYFIIPVNWNISFTLAWSCKLYNLHNVKIFWEDHKNLKKYLNLFLFLSYWIFFYKKEFCFSFFLVFSQYLNFTHITSSYLLHGVSHVCLTLGSST